tara:strand:+ start:6452 stop:6838 length:387 start_codon:yes stop_codon:yes gene_type:complete
MKIKEFTQYNLKDLRTRLEARLAPLEEEFGIKIKQGNFRYGVGQARMSGLTFDVVEEGKTPEQSAFERDCWQVSLKATDYKKEVVHGGNTYILVGVRPRARKNKILMHVKGQKATRYVFREGVISHLK